MSDNTPSSADDFALDRLRAADPAIGDHVDPQSIRLSVAEKLAVSGQAPVDELTGRRHAADTSGRRVPWIAVAAGVCALALAAGAGYIGGRSAGGSAVAASESSGDAATSAAVPSVAQGGAVTTTGGVVGGSGPVAGTTGSGVAVAPGPAAMPAYNQRVEYVAGSGLSTSGGQATGYTYNAPAIDGKAVAQRLAHALGIPGAAVQSAGTWTVGTTDGSGATVGVSSDGMRSFSAYDPKLAPQSGCAIAVPQGAPATPVPAPATDSPCAAGQPTAAPAPSADVSVAAAKALMSVTGTDPADFQWHPTSSPGDPTTYVNAAEVVGGQLTGASWGFTVVGSGTVSGVNGFLAPLVSLGEYPTVSARQAVDRLGDQRYAISPYSGGPVPMAGSGIAVTAPAGGTGGATSSPGAPNAMPTSPPVPPSPGSQFAWPVTRVTITSATPGLAAQTLPTGAVVLIPVYEMAGDNGVTALAVSVTDAALARTSG